MERWAEVACGFVAAKAKDGLAAVLIGASQTTTAGIPYLQGACAGSSATGK